MGLVLPVLVRADDGPDQDHRRAGCAGKARQDHAAEHDRGIQRRRSAKIPADMDAARYHEQRADKRDERDILKDQHMDELMKRSAGPENGRERHKKRQAPEQGYQAIVAMPEMRRKRWQDRQGAQDTRERQHPEEAQLGAIDCRVRSSANAAGCKSCREESAGGSERAAGLAGNFRESVESHDDADLSVKRGLSVP